MKKFLPPVLGLVAVLGLFSFDVAFAALIGEGDNPQNIKLATTAWGGSARTAIKVVVNYFLYFLGLIATIMVIYGGFLYVTAGGDDAGAEKGKKILLYAAIGIIVILVSYALVNTIIGSGVNVEPL